MTIHLKKNYELFTEMIFPLHHISTPKTTVSVVNNPIRSQNILTKH